MKRRKSPEPVPVGEILPELLRGIRASRRGPAEKVRAIWPHIAGEAVARRCRIAGCEDGVVTVEVASAALKHDLATFRREALLRDLREKLPGLALRDLRFKVGAVR